MVTAANSVCTYVRACECVYDWYVRCVNEVCMMRVCGVLTLRNAMHRSWEGTVGWDKERKVKGFRGEGMRQGSDDC